MAITTADVVDTASDAISAVVSIYKAREKAVAAMEAVIVVVDTTTLSNLRLIQKVSFDGTGGTALI
jgi:hypothetical protein